ncbi:hypothetical protein SAMN02745150_01090 [Brevinema andersonii]|uniref:Uncharacterized protein n=1 Tax=Brevinema andersonii TaxID=34097 RepID=A0A1I1EFM9_BREAD|nr:hypothetical protein [Brevinema andersonii]SFB85837.1 hypothetical protein SAMN02745150_01090 [Brevinema andersonii]
MDYPVKFLLPDRGFKSVSIQGQGFPEDTDLTLRYCSRKKSFSTTLFLPEGVYRYRFNADGQIMDDPFRTRGSEAVLYLGGENVFFDETKIFFDGNDLVIILNINNAIWFDAVLNVQTLSGIQAVKSVCFFYEGTHKYLRFAIPTDNQEKIYTYFELQGIDRLKFFGKNGLHDREWLIEPFLIVRSQVKSTIRHDITAVYMLDSPKNIKDFEKRHDYFNLFIVDYVDAPLSVKSPLLQYMQTVPDDLSVYKDLAFLLREFFLEQGDIIPVSALIGRFFYEHCDKMLQFRIKLSDEHVSFWDAVRRNIPAATRAIAFQFLCCGVPEILFGEEVGLAKLGMERRMYWTKARWNKELFYFYCKMISLRKQYPVLRLGGMRFVIQDCGIWGIERFMPGEPSIFIFANHSKDNIVIDLTRFVGESFNIKELLTDYLLKRKKVCTIYADSVAVYIAYSKDPLAKG